MAEAEKGGEAPTQAIGGSIEDDPQYALLVESNELIAAIDAEVAVVHRYVRDIYAAKFGELETMVTHPLDYFKVVQIIGNETVRGVLGVGCWCIACAKGMSSRISVDADTGYDK